MGEFRCWKEQEEEDTYTTFYVRRQQTSKPKTSESKNDYLLVMLPYY